MTMVGLAGHQDQRRQVSLAVQAGRLPQLVLLTGPTGVGKQRFGLWMAQRILCENPAAVEPCGECRQCRLVLNLSHPDVHWFIPVLRPKAAEPDKQIDELEEALGEALEQRRKDSLYGPPEGLAGHFVATARLIGRRAALRSVEGRDQVFLIGYSERLVPQEASPEAANALLKLLEEPPRGARFILCAADIDAVLPTIRSRAVQMRLAPLTEQEVRGFLREHGRIEPNDLDSRVSRANGAIGRALDESESGEKAMETALALLESARAKSPAGWEMALKQTPFSARGEFTDTLDAMAELVVEATRSGSDSRRTGQLSKVPRPRLMEALAKIGEAREMAQNNVNPQLLLATLNLELTEVL
jgi:DNA polymerase-3 subunit delta'